MSFTFFFNITGNIIASPDPEISDSNPTKETFFNISLKFNLFFNFNFLISNIIIIIVLKIKFVILKWIFFLNYETSQLEFNSFQAIQSIFMDLK